MTKHRLREITLAMIRERTVEDGGCWLWTGALRNGYGAMSQRVSADVADGWRTLYVHRLTYQLVIGPIPPGLQLDHVCRVRRCVNPEHLETVTAQENKRRGMSPAAVNARKTTCPQGHPYDMTTGSGGRGCRTCLYRWQRENYLAKKRQRDAN